MIVQVRNGMLTRSTCCSSASVVVGNRRVLSLHCSLSRGELHRVRSLACASSVAHDEPLLHLQAGTVECDLSLRTILSHPFIQLSTFSHQQFWHIACNMIALVSFGRFAYVAVRSTLSRRTALGTSNSMPSISQQASSPPTCPICTNTSYERR